jgi:hypothetical protein
MTAIGALLSGIEKWLVRMGLKPQEQHNQETKDQDQASKIDF